MSGVGEGQAGDPAGRRSESGRKFSRRAVLQAGLFGAATLAAGGVLRPRAAPAAITSDAGSAPGVYSLNTNWLFGGAYVAGSEAPSYPEAGFAGVTIPHIVTPLGWGDWDHTAWEQVWIYRKHITQSAQAYGRVFVDFQGVMTNATVYLGGAQLSQHQGGYLPWSVELTQDLVPGDNVLAVVVDGRWLDVPPDGAAGGAWAVDYLQPAGIYRDVALRIVPEVFISDLFAKPVNVLTSPSVEVQFTIDAAVVPGQPVTLTAALMDGSTQVASGNGAATISSVGTMTATVTISGLSGVSLWSPEHPKLYQVNGTIVADGVSHTVQVRIGFRQATFEVGGFYLNGARYEIFGLNRHQLFPYTGMAAPERLQRRDAELLKNVLNCNMVRCSHYPQSPYFLDACDELGLMVWEEPPGWQYVGDAAFQDIVVQNVQDMVVRDRNRPSVIVWATRLNETANYTTLYAETRQLADTLDGSRQTTGAMYTQSTTGWAQDVFAYDDYHSSSGKAILEPPLSGIPYFVSEAVGALDGAPLYRWIDSDATLALQAKMHAQVHDLAQANTSFAGLIAWAGIDYASLSGGNRIWHNVKWPGVLDTFRVPKPGAAFYRSQVDPAVIPVILPVFYWDFGPSSPPTGPGAGAMIATNCDRVELYVGGQHFATGTPDTADFGSLAYPPIFVDLTVSGSSLPELRIDGYLGSQLVSSVLMSADTTRDRLVIDIEDSAIQGDGTDATRFTFRVLDAYGNQRPYPTGDVTLSLTGPATLIADNPFPFAAYGGVGGAFIRSVAGGAGLVNVTAAHPTLGQASGQVTVLSVPGSGPAVSPPMPTAASPPTPTAPLAYPAAAVVRAALDAVLRPRGRGARISNLLKRGGYSFEFHAPTTGKLVIDWYYVRSATTSRNKRRLLVAAADVSIKQAGRKRVKVKLTKKGRSLLRRAKRERLIVDASFTPMGQSTVTATRVITLRR